MKNKLTDRDQICKELWEEIEEDIKKSLISDFVIHNRNLMIFRNLCSLIAKNSGQKLKQIEALPNKKFIYKLNTILKIESEEIIRLYGLLIDNYTKKFKGDIRSDFLEIQAKSFFECDFTEEEIDYLNKLNKKLKNSCDISETDNGSESNTNYDSILDKLYCVNLRTAKELLHKWPENEVKFILKFKLSLEEGPIFECTQKILKMDIQEIKEMEMPDPVKNLSFAERIKLIKVKFEIITKYIEDTLLPNLKKNNITEESVDEHFDDLKKSFENLKEDVIDRAEQLEITVKHKDKIFSTSDLEKLIEQIDERDVDESDFLELISFYSKFNKLCSKTRNKSLNDFLKLIETKIKEINNNKNNRDYINREKESISTEQFEFNQLNSLLINPSVSKEIVTNCSKYFGKELTYDIFHGEVYFESDKIESGIVDSPEIKEVKISENEYGNIEKGIIKEIVLDNSIENPTTLSKETKTEVDKPIELEAEKLKDVSKQRTIPEENTNEEFEEESESDLLASELLIKDITDDENKLLISVTNNLLRDNLSSAYLILNYLNEESEIIRRTWPDWTIEALAYSRYIFKGGDEFSTELGKIVENFSSLDYKYVDEKFQIGLNLIILSAMIKPALISPLTGASEILNNIKFSNEYTFLNDFIFSIQKFSSYNYSLSQDLIATLNGKLSFETDFESFKEEVDIWMERVKNCKIGFFPAEDLLRKWIEKDGIIYLIMNPIINNELSKIKNIKSIISDLNSEHSIHKKIDQDIKKLHNGHVTIEGPKKLFLTSRLQNAINFFNTWEEIQGNKKVEKNNFKVKLVTDFFNNWKKNIEEVKNKLSEIKVEESIQLAGIKLLEISISNINDYLSGNNLIKESFIFPKDILLMNETIFNNIDSNESNKDSKKYKKELIDFLSDKDAKIEWGSILTKYCETGNINIVDKIIEYFKFIDPEKPELEEWINLRERSYDEHIAKLRKMRSKTIDEVESSVMNMLLGEKEREDFNSLLSEEKRIDDFDFTKEYSKIDKIRMDLLERKSKQIKSFKDRLSDLKISDEYRKKIASYIEKEDIASSTILLDAAEKGEEKVIEIVRNESLEDFSSSFDEIEAYLGEYDHDKSKFINSIKDLKLGDKFGPINLSDNENDFENYKEIFLNWFEIKNNKSEYPEDKLKGIIRWFGWKIDSIKTHSLNNKDKSYKLETLDIPYCPLPAFGSDTGGKIEIVPIWGKFDSDLLPNLKLYKESKTIIFYFGRISKNERMELHHLSIKDRTTYLIIDDILFSYLVNTEKYILKYLYRLTFPFTYLKPYITAASILPDEMFFGRKKIMEGLMNPLGPCIIYGGRQLGKTVILKKLEREHCNSMDPILVMYCDLKQKGLGETVEDPSKIWSFISDLLFRNKIIEKKSKVNDAKSGNHVIQNYLNNNPDKRLLFFFDEADKFIEIDAKENFRTLTELNGLMRDTHGKFKFVLSGLHSVNRFSKISNSSIAHLLSRGSVCVGPMIENGEQREARNLIIKPFSILGFKFESDELISKILSLSNFYPSLIQLFCDKLLSLMYEQIYSYQSDYQFPPFSVTNEDIEKVYFKKKLKDEIVERFEWTLNLDPRYEVIAYLIAMKTIEIPSFDGLNSSTIKDLAEEWKKGLFLNSDSLDQYEDILNEMVSLGILRKSDISAYSIKNANVLALLGNREQVEEKLLNISESKQPELFAPEFQRSYLVDIPYKFSPLVSTQEGKLFESSNKLIYIVGSKALGIDKIEKFIKQGCDNFTIEYSEYIIKLSNKRELESTIKNFIAKDIESQSLLLIKGGNLPDNNILIDTIDSLNTKKSIKHFKKIVLVSNSDNLWGFLRRERETWDILKKKGLEVITLKKLSGLFISKWFKDNMVKTKIENCEKILGFWPGFYFDIAKPETDIEEYLKNFIEKINDPTKKDKLLELFNITNDEIRETLKLFSEFGCETSEEYIELADNEEQNELYKTVIEWGRMSEIFENKNNGNIDPIIKKIL